MAQHTSVGRPSTVGEFLAGVAGRSFTLALLGDVVLSGTQSAHDAWGSLLPLLLASDVRVCSLECAIAPARTQCGSALCRTQAVAAATVLSAARFQAVACANDHALDRGLDGMESTLSALSASGIACAGLGSNAAAACGAARFEVSVPGDIELLRVSLLAFADLGVSRGGEWAARNHHIGGIAVLDPADADSALVLQQAIALERAAGAELIIVAPHWGASDASQAPAAHVSFAHAAASAGADIVLGTSPQLPLGVEVVPRLNAPPSLVIYGAGIAMDDRASADAHLSLLYAIEMQRSSTGGSPQLRSVELVPLSLAAGRTDIATRTDKSWEQLRSHLTSSCAAFGSELHEATHDATTLRLSLSAASFESHASVARASRAIDASVTVSVANTAAALAHEGA